MFTLRWYTNDAYVVFQVGECELSITEAEVRKIFKTDEYKIDIQEVISRKTIIGVSKPQAELLKSNVESDFVFDLDKYAYCVEGVSKGD